MWNDVQWCETSGCTRAPKLTGKCEIKYSFPVVRTDGRCTVTWLPNFLGWVDLLSYEDPPMRARFARTWSSVIKTTRLSVTTWKRWLCKTTKWQQPPTEGLLQPWVNVSLLGFIRQVNSKLNMRIRFSLSHNLLNGLKLDTHQPKHVISRISIKKG